MNRVALLVLQLAAVATVPPAGAAQARPRPPAPACDPDNAGLTLPAGFCAVVAGDSLGRIRHLAAATNGDLFAAVRGDSGGVLALRDTNGDGRFDVRRKFGPAGGTGIALQSGYLYFASDDAVVRWPWRAGQLEPTGAPDTVVRQLVNRRQHAAKSIALGSGGALYVNIGAPSNSCQEQDRQEGSKGRDPCPILEEAGGIWRFDANRLGQTQQDGERYASGLRNAVAIAVDPAGGTPYAAQHGRDDLHRLWPALFSDGSSAEKPAEELFRLERGGNYGWPYCYYDPELQQKLLAPEYGGDGKTVGRCASAGKPVVAFPAHWAPNGILFYTGTQFPAEYRGGVFVAFHGSWNRAPLPQAGYNVTFVPAMRGGEGVGGLAGNYRVFAGGFAGGEVRVPRDARHRPTGLAQGPDGSLFVSDDQGGRVYRIMSRGGGAP